jgi:hypothetical protein
MNFALKGTLKLADNSISFIRISGSQIIQGEEQTKHHVKASPPQSLSCGPDVFHGQHLYDWWDRERRAEWTQ